MHTQALLRRTVQLALAALLALSALLTLNVGQAFAATRTWTGGGSDNNFSTGANWSGSTAPTNGDIITFDTASLGAAETLTNDISGLSLAGINATGGGDYGYVIAGQGITVTGPLSLAGSLYFTGTVTLGANVTVSGSRGLNLGYGANKGTLAVGTRTLTMSTSLYGTVSGSGTIIVQNNASATIETGSSFSGSLQVADGGSVSLYKNLAISNVSVASGGSITFCGYAGANFGGAVSVGGSGKYGSALSSYAQCGAGGGNAEFDPQASVNLTGAVTLTANTVVASLGEIKISGPLSGNYTVSMISGTSGRLNVASSNNTSGTPNGEQASQTETKEYKDNKPNESITVNTNQVAIIDGTYGDVYIAAGVLKGVGTIRSLSADGGTLAPGHSPGTLTVLQNLSLSGQSVYEVEIQSTQAYDQVRVGQDATLSNATLRAVAYSGLSVKAGDQFTIIDNQGSNPVTGTFAGLAEGATLAFGDGGVLRISYVGGDGNDVVLTVVSVPTAPATGLIGGSGASIVMIGAVFAAALGLVIIAKRLQPAAQRK